MSVQGDFIGVAIRCSFGRLRIISVLGTTRRVRVSGGYLGNAEAPIEPAGETVPYIVDFNFLLSLRTAVLHLIRQSKLTPSPQGEGFVRQSISFLGGSADYFGFRNNTQVVPLFKRFNCIFCGTTHSSLQFIFKS